MEHRWTRIRTRIGGRRHEDDWCVLCDGWVVGRVLRDHGGLARGGEWGWSVQSFPAESGHADRLGDALERIREGVTFGRDGRPETAEVLAWRQGGGTRRGR